jgi:hypothetical protein
LLEPYAASVNDEAAVSFVGALDDAERAIEWACQFGPVLFRKLEQDEIRKAKQQGDHREIAYAARLMKAKNEVYGQSVKETIILAGVQSLRETADNVLNATKGEWSH